MLPTCICMEYRNGHSRTGTGSYVYASRIRKSWINHLFQSKTSGYTPLTIESKWIVGLKDNWYWRGVGFIGSLMSIVEHWYGGRTLRPLPSACHERCYVVYHTRESNWRFVSWWRETDRGHLLHSDQIVITCWCKHPRIRSVPRYRIHTARNVPFHALDKFSVFFVPHINAGI